MLDASKSKGCAPLVQLHAACMVVRPFTRWFGRRRRNACNRWVVTCSARGGLASSVLGQLACRVGPSPRAVGGGPWSVLVKAQSTTAEDASGESRLFKKGSTSWVVAMPSHFPHASRSSAFRATGWGSPALSSSCCGRSTTSWRLVPFSHRSASRIFVVQPGCIPSPMITQDGDHQFDGEEKQAGLQPLPRPQLQGSSSSLLGRRARRVGACLDVG
jgi:hypothetical protein